MPTERRKAQQHFAGQERRGRPQKPEGERLRYRVRPIRLRLELDAKMAAIAEQCGLSKHAFIVRSVERLVAIHLAASASRTPAANSLYTNNYIDHVLATK